jgi:hypothetical protein
VVSGRASPGRRLPGARDVPASERLPTAPTRPAGGRQPRGLPSTGDGDDDADRHHGERTRHASHTAYGCTRTRGQLLGGRIGDDAPPACARQAPTD